MGFHQFSLALAVMMMIMLSKPNCGGAAVLVKSNTTYECNSLLNGCRIGEDLELELEFFMGSDVVRILQGMSGNQLTGGTNNRGRNAFNCPPGESYAACLARGSGQPGRRGVYDRTPPNP